MPLPLRHCGLLGRVCFTFLYLEICPFPKLHFLLYRKWIFLLKQPASRTSSCSKCSYRMARSIMIFGPMQKYHTILRIYFSSLPLIMSRRFTKFPAQGRPCTGGTCLKMAGYAKGSKFQNNLKQRFSIGAARTPRRCEKGHRGVRTSLCELLW